MLKKQKGKNKRHKEGDMIEWGKEEGQWFLPNGRYVVYAVPWK